MERADLVGLERADDGVQHTTVVEQDKVLLVPVVQSVTGLATALVDAPIMWVDELQAVVSAVERGRSEEAYARSNGGTLHLVQEVADRRQVGDVCAVRVQRALALCAGGQRVDEELADTARMDLEMQAACHGVLP